MSTSIVYYSHHGNNETLANHLSERGYENQGQAAALSAELARRVGRLPRALAELRVSDLVPLWMRRNLRVINAYRVQDAELARFQSALDEFLRAALAPPPSVADERKEKPLQAAI